MSRACFEILYNQEEEEPDFETGVEWLHHSAHRLFSPPAERFEGCKEGRESEEIEVHIKGSRIRSGAASGEGGFCTVLDVDSQTVWIANPHDRFFVAYTFAAAREAARAMDELEREQEDGGPSAPRTVRSLGSPEVVNGFQASVSEASRTDGIAVGWCAEDTCGLLRTLKTLSEGMGMTEGEDHRGPHRRGHHHGGGVHPLAGRPARNGVLARAGRPQRAARWTIDRWGRRS